MVPLLWVRIIWGKDDSESQNVFWRDDYILRGMTCCSNPCAQRWFPTEGYGRIPPADFGQCQPLDVDTRCSGCCDCNLRKWPWPQSNIKEWAHLLLLQSAQREAATLLRVGFVACTELQTGTVLRLPGSKVVWFRCAPASLWVSVKQDSILYRACL